MCKFLFVIFKVSITKIIKVGFTHFLKHYPEILFNLIKMLKNWKTKENKGTGILFYFLEQYPRPFVLTIFNPIKYVRSVF